MKAVTCEGTFEIVKGKMLCCEKPHSQLKLLQSFLIGMNNMNILVSVLFSKHPKMIETCERHTHAYFWLVILVVQDP